MNKEGIMKETKFVDLGRFGKWSVATLIKSRRKDKYYDPKYSKHKYNIPRILEDSFDKRERELRTQREKIEEQKHRKIFNIRVALRQLEKLDAKLKKIENYEKRVLEIINKEQAKF